MELTFEQKKLIYNAVRHYQISRAPLNGKDCCICDEILNDLFKEVKINYVEPAYEVSMDSMPIAKPPTPPTNGFGFNVQ
jgi:hypothetical protein